MQVYNKIYKLLNSSRIKEINTFIKHPVETQFFILKKIIEKNKNTEFCKKLSITDKTTYEEFSSRVPIFEYEQYFEYIKQTLNNKKNIITSDKIIFFAKSSGTTTGKSKYIPVTYNFLKTCHYKGGKDVLLFYLLNNPYSKIFNGKTLSLGGSFSEEFSNKNFKIGDLSAILIKNLPIWTVLFRTPPVKIALTSEWEEKIKKMTNYLKSQDITAAMGAPSWVITLFKSILKDTGKTYISEIWPNFELFVHGGMSFKPYIKSFNEIAGKKINFMEVYNASEGFFAIQNDLNFNDMLLMLDYGIFYEFIPFDENKTVDRNAVSLKDVELNKTYSLVITTFSGLWRYVIGDTIQFTSLTPPKIVINGRTKLYLNAFGEELIIDNVEKAINEACTKTTAIIREYTVAPLFSKSNTAGCHQWIFEFEKEPENIELFMTIIDESLKKINSDYEAKRYKNITIDFPSYIIVKKNTFYEWLKRNNKLGTQNKIPRLCNDRKFAEEILKINNEL